MPWMASACDAATWFVVETLFILMATYFLVRRTGRIWSSIATSASVMFLRRLSFLTSETVERFSVAAREQNAAGALGQVLTTYPQYVPELTEFSTALMATSSYEREALTPDVVSIAERARTRALAAVFPAQAAPQTAVQAAFASLLEEAAAVPPPQVILEAQSTVSSS